MQNLQALNIGDSLEKIELEPVSRLDLIKYAGASGDYNPIHTIDKAATKAGLPGIIAHGMWTMGNLGKVFSPYLDQGFIQKFHVGFSGMVFLGDVVTLHAELAERKEGRYIFDVEAVKQDEKTALQGQIVFQNYNSEQEVD